MDLQEFMNLHPLLVDVERVGIEGIDLQLLHDSIEKSEFLKTRRSFIYLVKNYSKIIAGERETFPKFEKKEAPVLSEKTLAQIERQKERLAKIKALNVNENVLEECSRMADCSFAEFVSLMEKAVEMPGYIPTAVVKYNEFIGGLYELGIKI